MLYTINNQEIKGNYDSRICGLDLIRVVAIFFVIAGHFFSLNTPYNSSLINSWSMVIQGGMLSIFGSAVPLFMMLTGYLNINKTPSKKYYKGMVRVLVAYLLFSIVTIVFRKYYLGEELSVAQWVLKIFDYSAIPYAWYIEMWIGLALLTPFLNYLYHAIPTIREKILLIGVLFVMSSLPYFVNNQLPIFPDYFTQACYPLVFFFMGAFIREYQPTIKIRLGILVVLVVSLVNPLVTILLNGCGSISVQVAGGPGSALRVWIAVAIFLMLYRRDISVSCIKRWVTHCSMVSLEMYLCCYMFDQLYYPWFKGHFFVSQTQFLPWFLVIVPLCFFSAYLVAAGYNAVNRIVTKTKTKTKTFEP